jgi:hypothetical protein
LYQHPNWQVTSGGDEPEARRNSLPQATIGLVVSLTFKAVALSLTMLARQLQVDFEGEMNVVLGISP